MKMKYQSELLMACHEEAQALFSVGAITKEEMGEFDEACLDREPEPVCGVPQGKKPVKVKC